MVITSTADPSGSPGFWRLVRAASRPSRLAAAVGVLVVISGVVTYVTVKGLVPYRPPPATFVALLLVNLTLVLTLGALIAWRLTRLWSDRRSGLAGARLHVRLVVMFSLIAVVPTILVAAYAAVSVNLGVQTWFSRDVKSALDSAVIAARHYVEGQHDQISRDVFEIATTIENDPEWRGENNQVRSDILFEKLGTLTKAHGLQAAYILDSQGRIIGSTKRMSLTDVSMPNGAALARAASGQAVFQADVKRGLLEALWRMEALHDAYLFVVRSVDKDELTYYQKSLRAVSEYNRLDNSLLQVQLIFAALYVAVSLLILLAAIWLGLWAANSLVRPVSRLINAAERVSKGDLKAQVEIDRDDDEMGTLGHAFNSMTRELDAQRSDLITANEQLDTRRRFTEAVLAGVSAGVIGLDGEGTVTIINRAAARLLNAAPEEMEGRHYSEAVPELAALVRRALQEPVGRSSGEATIKRAATVRTLSVQVASEAGGGSAGYIVTFDDITDLVSAQRTAAWADVARRIAHEIKNPLTPIQLSAERLKRKYGGEVTTDPEIFRQCTDTIIRQVGDIGRMVDEFSSFARMPTPVMRRENAGELIQQAVFLQRVANSDITFQPQLPKTPVYFECDGRLVSQALMNVLKNAGEAIGARVAQGGEEPGRISIAVAEEDGRAVFRVEDNGIGLPDEHRHRLTEPYVTTRAKGTGLGLAIVRKILEDHGGEIILRDRQDETQGAEVRLIFPLRQKPGKELQKGNGDEQERIANLA
ncbi:MAG: PAS domain-containing sensor histidine kinase [Rhizomicrobium sp.]|jgi:two-component system nitrogen regulation sensor histidine kinase NtrY